MRAFEMRGSLIALHFTKTPHEGTTDHLRHRQPQSLRNGIGLSMKAGEEEIANAFFVFLNTIQFGKTT